jgi:menaquinone-specific isochorismate synthase
VGSSARLFAGVGIVADSDPAAELAETQLKLQAFLAAAVRP